MDNATFRRAIAEAGIDAPVRSFSRGEDGSITFRLPQRTVVWIPDDMPEAEPKAIAVADFTAIPYVGDEICRAMHDAGFSTYDDLVAASDKDLLAIASVNTFTLKKIRDYLKEHYL